MGIFKHKAKDAAGVVHVNGAGGMIDPAAPSAARRHRSVAGRRPDLGSPSTASPCRTTPTSRRDAQASGINDEAGMITLAQERGWNPADTKAALDGWVQRMGQSMAVGQQFRKLLGY